MTRTRLWIATAILAAGATACGSKSSPAPETPPAPTTPPETAQPAPAPEVVGNPSNDLIPRELLFGNPERASPQISPDGTQLAFLAPSEGVLNVWVAPVGDLAAARPVTADKTRPVRLYDWAYDGTHILYLQDAGGDENWHVYSVDLATGKAVDLTPIEGIQGQIAKVSHKKPGTIVVGINDRTPMLHDLYTVDIATGEREKLLENPGFIGFELDDDYKVKLGAKMRPDGGFLYQTPGKKGEWTDVLAVEPVDSLTTSVIGLDAQGDDLYLWDSRGRDTSAFATMPLGKGKAKILAEHPKADGSGVMLHPTKKTPQAVSFNYLKEEWEPLDNAVRADLEKLDELGDGEIAITSRTLDDSTWIVALVDDDGPIRYYLYDRKAKKADFLFTNRPALEQVELAPMHPVVIESRDGLELVSYLTLPKGSDADGDAKPESPQPLVLLVHGGPWGRDSWGYSSLHQMLSDRGYAVLSPNFRGSTGFGKAFVNAGDKEWGRKMHDDLIDAVNWAVESGVAPVDKICIMGGSYGGYATLVGLTMTPEVFACGVDIVGPSNIITLLEAIPPYWKPMQDLFKNRVGDWTTEEGKKMLLERSPLSHVDAIQRPLLIGQGANDPRVKQAEADQIVEAMQAKQIPVTYVLFPDEGHGFARPENSMAFWAVTEAFLSPILGGTYQPIEPGDLEGSSIKVPAGAERVPGLSKVLPQ